MISGYTVLRNGLKGDYCFKECIHSLLGVCDEVVVGNASSDDGTTEILEVMATNEPKLRIVMQSWTQPFRDVRWFVDWINRTRLKLKYPMQLALDADEVLDERAYPMILDATEKGHALWFERLNFERDCRTVIPHGETCGNLVVRFGPSHFWMPSDEPYESAADEPEIRKVAKFYDGSLPIIFHYGFLRRNEAMFEKSKVNLIGFFGKLDERLVQSENEGQHWLHHVKRKAPYRTYSGPHPEHCHAWLKERGAM